MKQNRRSNARWLGQLLPLQLFPVQTQWLIFASILLAGSAWLPAGVRLALVPVVCLTALLVYRVWRTSCSSSG